MLKVKSFEKPNNLEVFRAKRKEGIQRTAKLGYSHLCPKKENLSFYNNYIIYELYTSIINIDNKPCHCRNIEYCLFKNLMTL
jgi:hypothetical protein